MKGQFGDIMKQAQQMQERMKKMQEELANAEVTGEAKGMDDFGDQEVGEFGARKFTKQLGAGATELLLGSAGDQGVRDVLRLGWRE